MRRTRTFKLYLTIGDQWIATDKAQHWSANSWQSPYDGIYFSRAGAWVIVQGDDVRRVTPLEAAEWFDQNRYGIEAGSLRNGEGHWGTSQPRPDGEI